MIREVKEYIITQVREYFYRERREETGIAHQLNFVTEQASYAYGWVQLSQYLSGNVAEDTPKLTATVWAQVYLIGSDTSYVVDELPDGEMELKIEQHSDGSSPRPEEEFGSAWRWTRLDPPPLIMGEISEAYRDLFNRVIHQVLPVSQDPAYQEALKGLPIYRELA